MLIRSASELRGQHPKLPISSEILGETVFSGHVFEIVHAQDPETGGTLEFALASDSVRVYPVDRDRTVWLTSETRQGLSAQPFIRTVAGSIEPGETPEMAGRREMYEELGLEGGELRTFHTSVSNLKLLNQTHHLLATGWESGEQHLEPGERISLVRVPLEDVPELVWSGKVVEDPIALALLKLVRMELGHQ